MDTHVITPSSTSGGNPPIESGEQFGTGGAVSVGQCVHAKLTLCIVGNVRFHKCETCGEKFNITPFVIEVR